MVLVIWIFEGLGISEFITPILMPSIIGVVVIVSAAGLAMVLISRRVQGQEYSTSTNVTGSIGEQASDSSFGPPVRRPKGVFVIPMYCPHCGAPVDLQKPDWVGPRTLTCPGCYREIEVKTALR